MPTVPDPCPDCNGTGRQFTKRPTILLSWIQRRRCRSCGGDGSDRNGDPSDVELMIAWDAGGGFLPPRPDAVESTPCEEQSRS